MYIELYKMFHTSIVRQYSKLTKDGKGIKHLAQVISEAIENWVEWAGEPVDLHYEKLVYNSVQKYHVLKLC